MAKIDTPFMTKTAENHTRWGHTYLYKGVPPSRAIHKHVWGFELGSTEKQLQISGQSETSTIDRPTSDPAP